MQQLFEWVRILTDGERLLALLTPYMDSWLGYALLFAIIFAETGLLVGFFFPGDSLLFIAGVIAGAGDLNLGYLNAVLIAGAVLGDALGYALGKKTGPRIFCRPDSRLFKREYLDRTQRFYEKYGGKTIIYARFVPVVRTFAPFLAGVGQMSYRRFATFNVFGGIGWVLSMTFLGYWLGNLPFVRQHFEKIVLLIVLASVAPLVIEVWRHRQVQKSCELAPR